MHDSVMKDDGTVCWLDDRMMMGDVTATVVISTLSIVVLV